MPDKRRTRADGPDAKARRRDEILAAAKRAFSRKGFHATRISDVAEETDLSYGSVYWYFESKDELYDALLAGVESELRAAILESVSSDTSADVEKAIHRAIAGTFSYFDSDHDAVRLMFRVRGSGAAKDPTGGLYDRFAGDLEALVVDAQRDGLMAPGNPSVIAFAIAALIGQFAVRRLTETDSMSADEVAGFVLGLVLDGVRNN